MRDNSRMKYLFPLAVAALLVGCSSPVSSSSAEPSVSSEPEQSVSSVEQTTASESSSSAAPENLIYLYRASSHLFIKDANEKNNPFLKTYRHKYQEDVPFVDLDEFQQVRRLMDPALHYHNLIRLEDGRFDLTSSYGGHCYFDVKQQMVEIDDADRFYAEFSEGLTGDFIDPCVGYAYLKGSPKTKYLTKGGKTTYPLKNYHMDLVEQDGRLYLPFSLASHLLVNPIHSCIAYNGKDFYGNKLLGQEANTVRAYSNSTGFLWAYQKTPDTGIHFSRVTPKDGERYRFEGTMKDMLKKEVKCNAVFLPDGSLTIKSEDVMETVDYKGDWKQEGDILVANLVSEGMGGKETQYIDLSEGGYYRQSERTASMGAATYYQLCMDFDYQYGLKDMLQISSFDAEFERLGHKGTLIGKDVDAYQDTLSKWLISGKMGDGHYRAIAEGFSSLHPGESIASKYSSYAGERMIRYQEGSAKVSQARSSGTFKNTTLNVEGETAVITFSSFMADYKKEFKGIDAYKVPEGTENVDAFLTSKMTTHFVEGVCYALNEVAKNTAIKNVCFDVGFNIGGYVMFVPFLSAIMTDDPVVTVENSISHSRIEAHYTADLNADGVFGGTSDTWKGKYNYYVIQAGGSFSAGNIFPTAAKNGGYATTIGEATAGGGCGVMARTDITGYYFQYNGPLGFPEHRADGSYVNSEAGTTPMVAMDVADVYNLAKLDAKLKTLKA